jgi:hypothetical protein
MSKLTLSIDDSVIVRAKRYANQHGFSVSRLVEIYLDAVAAPPVPATEPPVLRSLRGSLKKGDLDDYRKHLREKYR